ncbi:MAG TPA: hypothetical protein VEJ63_11580 [Planctomycetota bacterium]|nr:hypothetical protein [Planctomycetota bacterium]
MNRWKHIAMFLVLVTACLHSEEVWPGIARAQTAAGIKGIGAARVGDGSEIDKEWQKVQHETAERDRQRNAVFEEMAKQGITGMTESTNKEGKVKAEYYYGKANFHKVDTTFKADFVVKVEPPGNRGNTVAVGSGDNIYIVSMNYMTGFMAVRKLASGEGLGYHSLLTEPTKMYDKQLKEKGQQLTTEQVEKIAPLIKLAENLKLEEACAALEKNLKDQALIDDFVRRGVAADELSSRMMTETMSLLTGEQQVAMWGRAHVASKKMMDASFDFGTGGLSFGDSEGGISITMDDKPLPDAIRSVVYIVNNMLDAKLKEPVVPEELKQKIVNGTLLVKDPADALPKLLNLVDARLEDGKIVVGKK